MYILLFFSYAFAVWYLFRVSKGVRELPGNLQSATSTVPSGKALMYFGLLLATGVFFVFISFTMFLPVMVLMPQKFAICFTLGCGFIIGSFFALRGPSNQLAHMSSKEVYLLYYIPMVYFSTWSLMVWQTISLILICCLILFLYGIFVIYPETSFDIGIYRQYGGYHICFHGASQLHTLCALLCDSGF